MALNERHKLTVRTSFAQEAAGFVVTGADLALNSSLETWPRATDRPGDLKWTRAAALFLMITPWHVVGAHAETTPACAREQHVQVDGQRSWRCKFQFQARQPTLVRVDHQRIDVALELLASDGRQIVKVDSPTLRSGPELMLLTTYAEGQYTLVVSPIDHRAPKTELRVGIENLPRGATRPALELGLAALTASAKVSDKIDRENSEQRITRLQDAVRQFKAAGDSGLEAEAHLRIANIYYWTLGDWQKSADAALTAVGTFAQAQLPVMASRAAALRAASLVEIAQDPPQGGVRSARSRSADFQEARRLLEGAAATFHREGLAYDEAHALNSLGLAFFYQGIADDARAHYSQAARIFSRLGESSSAASALGNIAVLEYEQGNYASAAASFEAVRARVDPASNPATYVSLLNNLAISYFASGRIGDALDVLLTALPLTQSDVDPSHRALTLHALGRVYLIVGDVDRATVFLRQALELRRLESTHDRRGLLTSLIRNGDLERERGDTGAAIKLHDEALEHAVSVSEKARVLLAMGTDQIVKGSSAMAIGTFDRALALDLDDEWPIKAALMSGLGEARMLSGDASGRELLLQAATAARAASDNELAAQNYSFLASQDYRAGKLDSALDYIHQAVTLYGLQRLGAINPDMRATYVANRADTYDLQSTIYMSLRQRSSSRDEKDRMGLAALLGIESLRLGAIEDFRRLKGAKPVAEGAAADDPLIELDARIAAKRFRLATILEQQKPSAERVAALRRELALLRSELDVAQAGNSKAKAASVDRRDPASLRQLQDSVAADTALVSWLPGEERSWIWCITQQRASAFELAGRRKLEEAARALYAQWSNPLSGADQEGERRISRILLGDAAECLRDTRNVNVVADGVLRSIPVGALWITDTTGGARRIVERHLVSYRTSMTSWKAGISDHDNPASNRAILLVGDPVLQDQRLSPVASNQQRGGVDYAYRDLRPLPGAGREVAAIEELAKGWQAVSLVRERATRDAFLAEPLGKFRVIHFATHALLDVHDPQLSALVLSGASALNLRDVMNLNLQTDAVVLGACEASLGKQYRGQLSLGLSEAFIFAGAVNVLGSLWPVSDNATTRYMRSFYQRYIQQGLAPPAAAQAAALEVMHDARSRHPFYWAAFVNLTT
jgi:CHAT domain-containing protein/tetratricopeptide (TPR) repeat protein